MTTLILIAGIAVAYLAIASLYLAPVKTSDNLLHGRTMAQRPAGSFRNFVR